MQWELLHKTLNLTTKHCDAFRFCFKSIGLNIKNIKKSKVFPILPWIYISCFYICQNRWQIFDFKSECTNNKYTHPLFTKSIKESFIPNQSHPLLVSGSEQIQMEPSFSKLHQLIFRKNENGQRTLSYVYLHEKDTF